MLRLLSDEIDVGEVELEDLLLELLEERLLPELIVDVDDALETEEVELVAVDSEEVELVD